MPIAGTWSAALKLGDVGRREIRGHELPFYLDELERAREATLAALGAMMMRGWKRRYALRPL